MSPATDAEIERETIVRLNREQAQRVFELLQDPPRPNAALIAARAMHRKLIKADAPRD